MQQAGRAGRAGSRCRRRQLTGQPASFSFGPERLGADYMKARAELDKRVPASASPRCRRRRAPSSNAILRICAARPAEISATLAEHPSDPLLQDLLMSTYQSELQLLARRERAADRRLVRTDL